MMALLCPLTALSAWAQRPTLVAGTTGKGAALASVRLVGAVSGSRCDDEHYR